MNPYVESADSDEDPEEVGEDEQDASDSESFTTSSSDDTIDPHAELLEDLESDLLTLTLDAESILSSLPRETQLQLTAETDNLFDNYKHFGSMARLKIGVERFLLLGDEGGKLAFEEERYENDTERTAMQPGENRKPVHYGEAFMINHTEDDDEPKFHDKRYNGLRYIDGPESSDSGSHLHPLRIVDHDSIPYVTTLPWDPIATKMLWPAIQAWPRGLLSRINQIFSVADHEARVQLFHHVSRYGPSPVFRLGIAERLKSQYSTILETAEENNLGLTPETRAFLRGVYEKKNVLNVVERRLLALACRIADDSVEVFWDDLTRSRRGYQAMRIFMAARELERTDAANRSAAEKRRAEVFKSHVARFEQLNQRSHVGERGT